MSAILNKSEVGALKGNRFLVFQSLSEGFHNLSCAECWINSLHPSTEKAKNFTMKERMG